MSIAIRLPEALELELCELAKQTKRSKSFLVREAIASYIENVKDYQAGIEALKNTTRIYSSKELRKELGLDN